MNLPEGFVLDEDKKAGVSAVNLPEGFVLDGNERPGIGSRLLTGAKKNLGAMAEGAFNAVVHPNDTLHAVADFASAQDYALRDTLGISQDKYQTPEAEQRIKTLAQPTIDTYQKSIEDPAGIPGRIANYAIDNPVNAALAVSGAAKFLQPAAEAEGLSKTASALQGVEKYANPVTPVTETASAINKGIDKIPYVKAIKPSNWLPSVYQRAKNSPLAQEGQALEDSTGVMLTPAQKTGNRFLNYAEQTTRDAAATADDVRAFDIKQANQAIDSVNRTLNKIGKGGKGAETVGLEVQSAVKDAVDTVKKVRKVQAEVDYGAVRVMAGDKPIIKLNNLKAELQNIVEDFDVPGGEPIVKQAKSMLSQVDGKKTIDKAMNIRRVYSEASRGTGNIFGDLDKAQSRTLASRLTRAVESDFEAAPTAVEGMGNLKQALTEANANYKTYSQHINAIENSVLGKMIGKDILDPLSGMVVKGVAPEKVANKLLSLHPSELSVAKQVLQGRSPETWNTVRRYAIEQSLEKSMDIPPSSGMNPVPISTSKFINQLPARKNLDILFNADELKDIADIKKTMVRMGDRTAANTSKTAIIADMLDWFTPQGATKAAGRAIGLKAVANAMTDPAGRAAMMDMAKARRVGDGSRYKFLRNAIMAEYAVGAVENNTLQGMK